MSYRRPAHKPSGGPRDRCSKCGLFGSQHDERRREYVATKNRENPRPKPSFRVIGVDGEGQGRKPHLYNFMGAADEHGQTWSLGSDPTRQLPTERCLDFLLDLPSRSLVFGFAFLYDLSKVLEGLPDRALYLLFHPEKRRVVREGKVHHRAVKWNGYRLNYLHRRFSVARGNRRVTVWDVFAFFQKRFTAALTDWSVGSASVVQRMEEMKERRSDFDAQSFPEIQEYCLSECVMLAKLGRELIEAHNAAEMPLKTYYGAGSTASSLLTKYEVKEYMGEIPDEMKEAVACSFFGGRFENRIIGPIRRPIYSYDISSAYPYAATFLPCLCHGRWRRWHRNLDNAMDRATLALVKWQCNGVKADEPWGPLPCRKADGTIAFPLNAVGGWTWLPEFLAARSLSSGVVATEVWTYQTECICRPFGFLPAVYLERLRIGKEGRGLVLKLGPNSVYGKLVQSIGSAPFQQWVWGSMITANCRAQCLMGIATAPRPENVLMIATDSLWSDVPLDLPTPRDTGTGHTPKPLGGWERKDYPEGVFAARPGVYFPLKEIEREPEETDAELKDRERALVEKMRARGLGRKALYERRRDVVEAFEAGKPSVSILGSQRFIGARSGVTWSRKTGCVRREDYGDWVDWPIEVTFDPKPKRMAVREDGGLVAWTNFKVPSLPYKKAIRSHEDELLEIACQIADEQPNGEYVDK